MLKQRKRIPRKRATRRRKRPGLFFKPERDVRFLDTRSYVTKGGRYRLEGDDYGLLRRRAFNRAHGHCECGCGRIAPLCVPYEARPWEGDVSHNEHGARKSDELDRVKWMRHECHMKIHNPKACPKKAA